MGQAPHPPGTKVYKGTLLCRLNFRAQELCESRGGRTRLPVPNSSYGLCGRKPILNLNRLNLSYAWRCRNMVRSKVLATERVADFVSIWSGDVFFDTITNSCFTSSLPRCALFSRASFWRHQHVFGVSDRTPGTLSFAYYMSLKNACGL